MSAAEIKQPTLFSKNEIALKGEFTVDGDKSISHRSLIFSALANGRSKIFGLLEGEDVLKTAQALRLMGVEVEKKSDFWEVNGCGIAGLNEPADVLDMGNSGTAARLMAGLVTPYNFTSFFTGDASLRKRPMNRVFDPIKQFGASIVSRQNGLMPFAIIGAKHAVPIDYTMKIASAQVKSCILLSALAVNGKTTIIEPEKCRDHTEIMMKYLGLNIETQDVEVSGKIVNKISCQGLQDFAARDFYVPGDISSAAFIIVAALLIEGSSVKINNVGINPLRTGIITTLLEMGANISLENERLVAGEKVADLKVEYSKLKGINIPAEPASSMIDEYPILSIAAAHAEGMTRMNGLAELKVKESNRLKMIVDNLELCGASVKSGDDFIEIQGGVGQKKATIEAVTAMDHRIAMSFLIMGLTLENGVKIDDASMIKTSFPNFFKIFPF
jgi:3-phosphoshikimate 1-carboxyvinyltransferase